MVTSLCAGFLLFVSGGTAGASAFLPPSGKIFQGMAGADLPSYTHAVGKHPAVYEEFLAWGQWVPGIVSDAQDAGARLMIMISTCSGAQEMITPAQIAPAGATPG